MRSTFLLGWLFAWVVGVGVSSGADAWTEVKTFSGLDDFDPALVSKGEIVTHRGALMDFSRGIFVQAAFVTKLPPDQLVGFYRTWDASSHKDLNLFVHQPVQSPPIDSDFQRLNLEDGRAPFRWVVKETAAITEASSAFQMSRSGAVHAMEVMKSAGAPAELAARFWRERLKFRVQGFQTRGFKGDPPYDYESEPILVGNEIQSLLSEETRITEHFEPILQETPVRKEDPKAWIEPYFYWEMLDISGHATFNLGAFYVKKLDSSHYQTLDLTYYSSGGIYTSFTLSDIWKVEVEGGPASLVWQGQFVSAPSLALTRGVERMATGKIMVQELKKSIRYFQKDAESYSKKL